MALFFSGHSIPSQHGGGDASLNPDPDVLNQVGAGIASGSTSKDFISKVADLVSKRISVLNSATTSTNNFRPIDPNWRSYETSVPTVIAEVQPNTNPPVQFDNPIYENNLNDSFDEHHLLKKVPKPSKKKGFSSFKIF